MSRIIYLHDVEIRSLSNPHDDLPSDMQMSAQVIINQHIFLQTVLVDPEPSGHSWKFRLECQIPEQVDTFLVAIIRHSTTQGTRLLGFIELSPNQAIVFWALKARARLNLKKVNLDGPTLELIANFSVSEVLSTEPYNEQHLTRDQVTCVDGSLGTIMPDIKPMTEGRLIDFGKLLVMHERILFLPATNELRGGLLNLVGDSALDSWKASHISDYLNQAVCAYEDAVRDDSSRAGYIEDLGDALFHRFKQLGNLNDLNKAVLMVEEAVNLTPDGQPEKPVMLKNLGVALWSRYQQLGDISDLNECIIKEEAGVNLTLDDHPEKPRWLSSLGTSFRARFDKLGNLGDLNDYISNIRNSIHLTSDDDSDKPHRLDMLGNALSKRFDQLGDPADLNESIQKHKDAVHLTPDGHANGPRRLNDLGVVLRTRFKQLGNLDDINECIINQENAVHLTPNNHPNKPGRLDNLGVSLHARFDHLGDLNDLHECILKQEDAVSQTPDDHPEKLARLGNLAVALEKRFHRVGDIADLNDCISKQEDGVALAPDDHPHKAATLDNLASALRTRFTKLGDLSDLNKCISKQEIAVHLTPNDNPDMARRLNILGESILSHFEQYGHLSDLNECAPKLEEAVRMTPIDHPDKANRLHNLGDSLIARFNRLGDINDLDESISKREDANYLTPDGHPDKPGRLNNLGNSLQIRFEQLHNLDDLNKCILIQEDVVCLTPNDHPEKLARLSNLAVALKRRFEQSNNLADLNEAIAKQEDALHLTPDNPSALTNLATCLSTRFEQLGDLNDLNECISKRRDVVKMTPDSHPDKPRRLGNLSVALNRRFDRLGNLDDLNECISLQKDAVYLTPDDHPDMPGLLSNFGNSLQSRFDKLGDLSDLNECILHQEEAVNLSADGHPEKPGRLNNLGNALCTRFEQFGHHSDLSKSISKQEEAICLATDHHPNKAGMHYNLANLLLKKPQNPNNMQEAVHQYAAAACASTGFTYVKFRAALQWGLGARAIQHPSLMEAYNVAFTLLPEVAWLGLSIQDRHHRILIAGPLVRDAVSAALSVGQPIQAVEWLEQGRSIIWSQLLNLRTPVDDLKQKYPKLADEFILLSAQLEGTTTRTDDPQFSSVKGQQSVQFITHQSHENARKRDVLLKEIQELDGFQRFLLPKTISELWPAAQQGPVVFLNVSSTSCDALALLPGLKNDVMHIPFPRFDSHNVETLAASFQRLIPYMGRGDIDRLHGQHEGGSHSLEDDFAYILSELWVQLVKPILDSLGITTSTRDNLKRIWWCPTGPLANLPIHAAGLYGKDDTFGSKLSDFVISSYTPSLAALIQGFRPNSQSEAGFQLLAVAQPSAVGQSYIPGTKDEIKRIQQCASGYVPVQCLVEHDATIAKVEDGIMKSNWVHFACHGVQDKSTPTKSALLLAGSSRLTLERIIQFNLLHADLAFLSACQTATGDKQLQEESVHLAAGMLLAGYRGVIATMWSIMDNDAPQVAADVYKHLFKTSTRAPDSTRAAEALHIAVRNLREGSGKKKSFFHWVPFIHVGV